MRVKIKETSYEKGGDCFQRDKASSRRGKILITAVEYLLVRIGMLLPQSLFVLSCVKCLFLPSLAAINPRDNYERGFANYNPVQATFKQLPAKTQAAMFQLSRTYVNLHCGYLLEPRLYIWSQNMDCEKFMTVGEEQQFYRSTCSSEIQHSCYFKL